MLLQLKTAEHPGCPAGPPCQSYLLGLEFVCVQGPITGLLQHPKFLGSSFILYAGITKAFQILSELQKRHAACDQACRFFSINTQASCRGPH